jgi:hypothetical protein
MAADFDVTSLHHRRASRRWERTSAGDLLERLTWSFPDKDAIIGREGAYGDEAFRRLSYRQANQIANQISTGCWPGAWSTATSSCSAARTRSRDT